MYARRCKPHCPLWKVVTVFQSKRQRLAVQCTIYRLATLVFKMRMFCRPIVSQKFSGEGRLLPRFTYMPTLKDASIAFCANCSNPSKATHKTASKNLGFRLRPTGRPKSFSVNTRLSKVRLFVVIILVLFRSNVPKTFLDPPVKVRGKAGERRSWAPKNCWRAFPGPTQPNL